MAEQAIRAPLRNRLTARLGVMQDQPPVHDLPERLERPLTTGEPWWYWLGGRPALDLVNTLRERWRRRVETLVTPGDLERWLVEAGVMAAAAGLAGDPEGLRAG